MKLTDKAKAFIGCAPIWREQGFNDFSVIVHAWHESGGFIRTVGKFNYWGIKTPIRSKWDGLTAVVITHEYEPVIKGETTDDALIRLGKKYGNNQIEIVGCDGRFWNFSLPASFRDWQSPEKAILWYCGFIKENYPNAFEKRSVPSSYFAGLVNGKLKYATDPKYVDKLTRLYLDMVDNADLQKYLKGVK